MIITEKISNTSAESGALDDIEVIGGYKVVQTYDELTALKELELDGTHILTNGCVVYVATGDEKGAYRWTVTETGTSKSYEFKKDASEAFSISLVDGEGKNSVRQVVTVEEGDTETTANTAYGENSTTLGSSNANDGKNAFVAGQHNINTVDDKAVFGRWNENKGNTLFEVGCGTSETNRRNAFEVFDDGRVRAYTPPKEPNDVIRLKEFSPIQTALGSIGNMINNGYEPVVFAGVVIPPTTNEIKNYAFHGANSLWRIAIHGGVYKIGQNAFSECQLLEIVTIANGVSIISDSAFHGCISLENIELPNSVHTIGDSAFRGCDKLKSIKLSPNLRAISNYTFADCSNLTNIENLSVVEAIGGQAFLNCSSLKEIELGTDLTIIGDLAFMDSGVGIIHYAGTKAQWNAITKTENWAKNSSVRKVVCTDGLLNI